MAARFKFGSSQFSRVSDAPSFFSSRSLAESETIVQVRRRVEQVEGGNFESHPAVRVGRLGRLINHNAATERTYDSEIS